MKATIKPLAPPPPPPPPPIIIPRGTPCYGGLDLARTRDTTALGLIFDLGDVLAAFAKLWLPEDTAKELVGTVPYQLWAQKGLITLTPGNVCDYEFVERDILALHAMFPLLELRFDPYNAENLTQRLEAGGIPRVAFAQTIGNFAAPTAELERLILSQKIVHDGHELLAWQIGNTKVKTDANGNKRPVKAGPDDVRKIDAVVGLTMAIAGWMIGNAVPAGSAYDTPEGGAILL